MFHCNIILLIDFHIGLTNDSIHSTVLTSRNVWWCTNSVSDTNHKESSFPCKFICSSFKLNQLSFRLSAF